MSLFTRYQNNTAALLSAVVIQIYFLFFFINVLRRVRKKKKSIEKEIIEVFGFEGLEEEKFKIVIKAQE